jgi:DNA-directed RNA polymerase specialized sigma24 family protein
LQWFASVNPASPKSTFRERNIRNPFSIRRVADHFRLPDLLALDDALNALAVFDERKAQVVELRFFGGLSVEETAAVLKISAITVMRDWNSAKAWLYRELTGFCFA